MKPANLGSSVAVSKVKTLAALPPALELAFAYDRKVVVERGHEVREIEVSVLGNDDPRASVPGEIVPDREFYDYDSKYDAASRTELHIPARISPAESDAVRALALAAFRAVDGAGYARVDCFLEKASGRLLLNEVNTIPGFTSISMYPKLWEASGLRYPELLARARLARARAPRRARAPHHALRRLVARRLAGRRRRDRVFQIAYKDRSRAGTSHIFVVRSGRLHATAISRDAHAEIGSWSLFK